MLKSKIAKEFFVIDDNSGHLEFMTKEAVQEKQIPANLILAKTIEAPSEIKPKSKRGNHLLEVWVNSAASFRGSIDPLSFLTFLADSIYVGHSTFLTLDEARMYFEEQGAWVELFENFDGVMGSLVSGVLGTASKEN